MLENSKHWLLESASRADQWQVRNIGIEKAALQSKKQHRNWKLFLFKFSHVLLNFLNQTSTTPVPAYAILPRACFAQTNGQKRRRLRLHSSVQRSHLRSSVVLVDSRKYDAPHFSVRLMWVIMGNPNKKSSSQELTMWGPFHIVPNRDHHGMPNLHLDIGARNL